MSPNKAIKRKRLIKYFIETAYEIIECDGLESITIRKVAEKAGYNGATIYNYFENLNHLTFLASMLYMKEYTSNLFQYTKNCKNSLDTYLAVWDCYLYYSFKRPDIYHAIFFPVFTKNHEEYIKQFYELYPDDINLHNPTIQNMLLTYNIHERDLSLLNDCVKEGFLSKDDVFTINDMFYLMYESMLVRVLRKNISPAKGKDTLNEYVRKILSLYEK